MRNIIAVFVLAAAAAAQTTPGAAQTPPGAVQTRPVPAQPQPVAPAGAGADKRMAIEAKLYFTREEAARALGVDPGPNVMIVQVTVTPKTEDGKLYLDHDQFLLRSDRDGQRARPLMPAQLAGSSVMVIGSRGVTTAAPVMGGQQRVPIGGVPGTPGADPRGRGGPPMTMPHPGQAQVGTPTASVSEATASFEEKKASEQQNLLLDVLKEKVLPEGEIDKPVSGLLYFQFEGKHRVRHMELVYSKAPPRIAVRFVEPKKK